MTPIRTLRLIALQRQQRRRARARTGTGALVRVVGIIVLVAVILNLAAFSGVVGGTGGRLLLHRPAVARPGTD